MYPVVIITKTTTYIQKRGWGSEPPTQTTTSYEGVSPTLLPASTLGACSVSCSLGSWWLFRAQTSATPPKFFPTLCNQRYGATPSFGIYRLIGLAPLGDLWPNAQTRLNHCMPSVQVWSLSLSEYYFDSRFCGNLQRIPSMDEFWVSHRALHILSSVNFL